MHLPAANVPQVRGSLTSAPERDIASKVGALGHNLRLLPNGHVRALFDQQESRRACEAMRLKLPWTATSRRGRAVGMGAVVAAAAVAAGGVVVATGTGAGAAENTATATTYRTQLIEMRTPGSAGYFYTANQAEYLRAQKLGFKFTGQVPGYVANTAIRGTVPLYRLRSVSRASYLLTLSATERNQLAASGKWRYEGVVGRVPVAAASDRVRIYRVSKSGLGWRVLRAASVKSYVAAGWRVDGSLGYVWTHK